MASSNGQDEATLCIQQTFHTSMLMAMTNASKRERPVYRSHDTPSTSTMAEDPTHRLLGPPGGLLLLLNELVIEIVTCLQPEDLWNFQKTSRTTFWIGVAGMERMNFLDRREHRRYVSSDLYQANLKKEESRILTKQFCCAGCNDTHAARLGDFAYNELEMFEAASRPYTKKDYIWRPVHENRPEHSSPTNITVRYMQRLSKKTPQRLLWASRKYAVAISVDGRRLTPENISKAIEKLRCLRAPLCLHSNSSDPDVLVRLGDEAATNLLNGQYALSKPIKCPFDKCEMYHFFSHYTSTAGPYQIVALEIRQFLDFAHNGGDMPLPTDESWLVNTMEMCKEPREKKPLRRMLRDYVANTRGKCITMEAILPFDEQVRRANERAHLKSAEQTLFA